MVYFQHDGGLQSIKVVQQDEELEGGAGKTNQTLSNVLAT